MTKELTKTKIALIKGALKLLWLEIKGLNWEKIKAIGRIIKSYVRMKIAIYRAKHPRKKELHLNDH